MASGSRAITGCALRADMVGVKVGSSAISAQRQDYPANGPSHVIAGGPRSAKTGSEQLQQESPSFEQCKYVMNWRSSSGHPGDCEKHAGPKCAEEPWSGINAADDCLPHWQSPSDRSS